MAELANRMEREADFSRRLSKLTTTQRKELRSKLGTPPNPGNVTDADWKRWEDERRGLLIVLLLLLSTDSATQHSEEITDEYGDKLGDQGADFQGKATDLARDWAVKTSAELAAEQIKNTREYLDRKVQVWQELQRDGGTVPEELIDADLVDLLGPRWDENTAITWTTNATTAGARGAVEAANEKETIVDLRWFTRQDDRVCPICGPLHLQPKEDWEQIIRGTAAPGWFEAIQAVRDNGGPTAHRRCRCWVDVVPYRPPANRTF